MILLLVLLNQATILETEEQLDLEIVLNDLDQLRQNPVNLNTASLDELLQIPYLSVADGLRILEQRVRVGAFQSFDELANILGFDPLFIERIRPFTTVGAKPIKLDRLSTRLRLKTEIPWEESSMHYYTKSQGLLNDYSLCLVTEKDPYENSFFDYYAAGLVIDQGSRRYALGKYNLDLGNGVVLSPFGSLFQAVDFHVLLRERGIIPYTSSIENGGFLGAALADSIFLGYTIFYSHQNLDGRVDSLGFAHSFDVSGEHVDSSSLSRKDKISEEIFGYDLRYWFGNLLISNRFYTCTYAPAFVTDDSIGHFYGSNFWISAIGLKYEGDNFLLFSEWARVHQNRLGGVFGFCGFFSYFDFNLVGKYFPVGFYSPKGAEADENYVGGTLDIKHNSRFLDLGTTLTIDNKTDEDSAKYDFRLNFEKELGILDAKLQMRWRYLEEQKDLSGLRVFLRLRPVKFFFLDLRLEEKKVYDQNDFERGIFGSLEAALELKDFAMRVRYGHFETDSYASRIYVYETDLPGVINNRMFYGRGENGYVYCSFKPIPTIMCSFKYSIIDRDSELTKEFGSQIDFKL